MAGSAQRSPRRERSRRWRGFTDGWVALLDRLRERPALLPLLAMGAILIGIAAGPSPTEGAWTGLPPAGLIRWVVASVVAVIALAGLVILLAFRGPTSGRVPPQRRSLLAGLVAPLVLAAILALLPRGEPGEIEVAPEPTPAAEAQIEPAPAVARPGFEMGDATALGAILVAGLVILWLLRRPRGDDETMAEADQGNDDPLGSAVGRAARHLLDQSDPRAAVLLAYHDLEATLDGLDLPRAASETPTEHLDRALSQLGVDDPEQARPLLDLAALYARARYSDHPITVDDQRRAADDLDRAHQRLVGTG